MDAHDATILQERPSLIIPHLAPETFVPKVTARASHVVTVEEVVAWIDAWESEFELPKPRSRKKK